jgi:hypothetical protein
MELIEFCATLIKYCVSVLERQNTPHGPRV